MIVVLPGAPAEPPPRFAFTNEHGGPAGSTGNDNQPSFGGGEVELSNVVIARAADGTSAWIAADAKGIVMRSDCAPDPCPPNRERPLHATGIVEKDAAGKWRWVAWHITEPVTAKLQAKLVELGVKPDPLARSIAGAEDAVKVFEAAIGDPKRFAAIVSDRDDVVLYGSEQRERTEGGAKVKAKLVRWKLAFKLNGGVQAGLAGKSVAWVAANVDATSAKTAKSAPYRVLALLEKTGGAWKLVQAHFSVDGGGYR